MTQAMSTAPRVRPTTARVVGPLGGVVVYLVAVGALHAAGVGFGAIGRGTAYWLLAVLVPGWLVARAALGAQLTWLAEVCIAACTGLALELLAWFAFSAVGQQRWLWLWPLVSLLILLRPSWRDRLRQRPTSALPVGWCLGLTVAGLVVIRFLYDTFLKVYGTPYAGRVLYGDMPWHMGLAAEARRALPLQTPQAITAGDLKYHWFLHAHVAAESLIDGTSVQLIMAQTYVIPLALLIVGMSAVLAHLLSGRAWAGGLAGVVAAAPQTVTWWPQLYGTMSAYIPLSPTQIYALPLTLFVLVTITMIYRRADPPVVVDGRDVFRSAGTPGVWLIFALSVFVVIGAKASAMPTLLGGAALGLLAALIVRRGRRAAALVAAVVVLATGIAARFVAGSTSDSGSQLLSIVGRSPLYDLLVGYEHYTANRWILPGVTVPWLLVGVALFEGLRLAGLLGTLVSFGSRLRSRPEAWLLTGCAVAAVLALFVIQHPGLSELYFVRGILPIGGIALAWALAEHVGERTVGAWYRSRVLWWCWAVGLGVAAIGAVGVVHTRDRGRPAAADAVPLVQKALLTLGAAVLLVVLVALVAGAIGRRRGVRTLAVMTVLSALLGLVGATVLVEVATPPPSQVAGSTTLSRAEAAAGRWISGHTGEFDLFATNDHCVAGEYYVCTANQWWISGLGGRRVLVEGWSYVPGSTGRRPFFDQALLRRNQAAYSSATPADLAWMRSRGVRYMVAVAGGGPVSERLFEQTRTVFQDGPVRIVELP